MGKPHLDPSIMIDRFFRFLSLAAAVCCARWADVIPHSLIDKANPDDWLAARILAIASAFFCIAWAFIFAFYAIRGEERNDL